MRTLLPAGLVALALSGAANAADMPSELVADSALVKENRDWSGFYVGGFGGYAWADFGNDTDLIDDDFDADGAIAGGVIGYNRQSGSWVLGLEADAAWTDLAISAVDEGGIGLPDNIDIDSDLTWLATGRARVGYAFNSVLLYATGGIAVGGIETTGLDDAVTFGSDDTRVGFAAGGGVEVGLIENISAKVEYLYVDLGEDTLGTDTELDFRAHAVKGGINYRF